MSAFLTQYLLFYGVSIGRLMHMHDISFSQNKQILWSFIKVEKHLIHHTKVLNICLSHKCVLKNLVLSNASFCWWFILLFREKPHHLFSTFLSSFIFNHLLMTITNVSSNMQKRLIYETWSGLNTLMSVYCKCPLLSYFGQ